MRWGVAGPSDLMADRFLGSPGYTRQNTLSTAQGDSDRESRILRDRFEKHEDAIDRIRNSGRAFSSSRQLVQMYNGGSMPATVPRVYFTHPVIAGGAETEGGSPSFSADTTTTVPVVFLGQVPSVGDYATAYAVGGRWVAERGKSSGGVGVVCEPCTIPAEDLTISWTNLIGGNGSATLTYSSMPGSSWSTGCVDEGIFFTLACTDGGIELRATFFVSGVCPTGETSYCSNLRAEPLALILSSYTCSPFSLTFAVGAAACPTLYSFGNTQCLITL
jgi:hypothetical protein